jgi:hypothetical protein
MDFGFLRKMEKWSFWVRFGCAVSEGFCSPRALKLRLLFIEKN